MTSWSAQVPTPSGGYVRLARSNGEAKSEQIFFYFAQGVTAAKVEIDTLIGDFTCLRADIETQPNGGVFAENKTGWSCHDRKKQ